MSLFWLLIFIVFTLVRNSESNQQETRESGFVKRNYFQKYSDKDEFNPIDILLNSYCYKRFFLDLFEPYEESAPSNEQYRTEARNKNVPTSTTSYLLQNDNVADYGHEAEGRIALRHWGSSLLNLFNKKQKTPEKTENDTPLSSVFTVTTCDARTSVNNTFWQSSTSASASSSCDITVNLEEEKPICQVRLDFISFSIAQPTDGDCTGDIFRVRGSVETAPFICGENSGQHMYLQIPDSSAKSTNLHLEFDFGIGITNRVWNIKIAKLPCGANYLAPPSCLQYFSSVAGTFSSFNWQNIGNAAEKRQLNEQHYHICFRKELIDSHQNAEKLCISVCRPMLRGGLPFFISGNSTAKGNGSLSGTAIGGGHGSGCHQDFLHFMAGTALGVSADRFCGAALNPAIGANNTQVCSSVKPFRITYITSKGNKTVSADAELAQKQGFCLTYQQF